jgi:hypothetical protein
MWLAEPHHGRSQQGPAIAPGRYLAQGRLIKVGFFFLLGTPYAPDVTVNFHKPLATRPYVKAVHVLRDQQEVLIIPLHLCDDLVSGIGPCLRNESPPPIVPFPNEFRVFEERSGGGKLFGPVFLPKTVLAPESGHTAFDRYTGASDHDQAL